MAGNSNSSDAADGTDKQALLGAAREIMAHQSLPPVFVDRLLDVVRENFDGNEIRQATPPQIKKGPIYVFVLGMIVSVVGSDLVQTIWPNWPQVLIFGVAGCVAVVSTLIALWMVLRHVKDKRFEDDALATLGRVYDSNLRFSLEGIGARGQLRRLRRRPPRDEAEVDALLLKWGWKNAGGRMFLLVAVMIYAVFLIVLAFQT